MTLATDPRIWQDLATIAAHLDLHIDHEPAGDAAGPRTPPVPASPPATNQPRDDGADDQP